MKKFLKITAIILFNIILFIILDFAFYINFSTFNKDIGFYEIAKKYVKHSKLIYFDELYSTLTSQNYFRKTIKNTNKRPILIFGCSYGRGYLLEEKDSFGYKLSNLTNRSVYNYSISSQGVNYFPYILEHYNIENEVKNPEYIIFVFIQDHAWRLYRQIMGISEPYVDILYKYTNDKIIETKLPCAFLYKSAVMRHVNVRNMHYLYTQTSEDEIFNFIKQVFLKAKTVANKKFPNSKIVILNYEELANNFFFTTSRWKELEDEGFIVLNSFSLTNEHLSQEKYKIKNDLHPNEMAWDLLTPKVVEKLELNN